MIVSTTIMALALMGQGGKGDALACPIMGSGANVKGVFSDYNGARYWFCCPGCDSQFGNEPAKFAALRAKEKASGEFLFDPVSGTRLQADKTIKEFSDYKGIRFKFQSAENKAAFDKNPAKFGVMPKKEALYCPVGKEAVPTYAAASGYVDHAGVRYYMCCGGCEGKFKADPAKFVPNAEKFVKAPGIATEKSKD